jgi:gliding motility-associated-like protein
MKKFIVLIITLFCSIQTFANHISGGELFYEYVGGGSAANTSKYKITMRLFRDCNPKDPLTQLLDAEVVVIGIYHSSGLLLQSSLPLKLQRPIPSIQFDTSSIPCLLKAPEVCFQVGVFTGTVELPATADGYVLSWVRCCRPNSIGNLSVSSGIGGTFVTTIPGTSLLPTGNNSSPQFAIKDTALVCQNKDFLLDFGAADPDGDNVSYAFCAAYSGGTLSNPDPGSPAGGGVSNELVLDPLPYNAPFSGTSPLGSSVSINPATGEITGKAPVAGRYVINVCATESRNGKVINEHRKDFILEVANCDFTAADPLPLSGAWCKDSTVLFSNNNSSSAIQTYHWDFGVPGATSEEATPAYTFPDTGVYTIKLTVHGTRGCVDEDSTTIGVYPGFKPDFDVIGSCFQTPFTFKDKSTLNYGSINSWKWSFGDGSDSSDIAAVQNPTHKYTGEGTRNVKLAITSSKGCADSITKPVEVKSVALLELPFRDTLICSIDTLALHAIGTGTYTWSPAYNIINTTSSDPFVFPKETTTYAVSVIDAGGCVNSDSIKVNVLNSITVDAGADTSICRTDSLTLLPVSAGLQYHWSPSAGLIPASNIKNPVASPNTTTTYVVTANLGKCEAKDEVRIKVAPYPKAFAGTDVIICYGSTAMLSGDITGTSFAWAPGNSLVNPNTLTPAANPVMTTSYILTAHDTLGCPKPVSDTIVVTVIPPVKAFAGNDTMVIANQPLQLNASGGSVYTWSPSAGMDNTSIANPVVILSASYDSIIYKVRVGTEGGCFAEDELKVKVFKTGPELFIPTAFTPDRNGKNDVLKPIPVGIRTLHYFRIYNRWGQMVYNTNSVGSGWDGTFDGKEQATGTYVFMAQATDFLGNLVSKKGTVVLIR